MRVAVTKGTLRVPPTYFAIQHAVALRGVHDFRFFTGAADIRDRASLGGLQVEDASARIPGLSSRPFSTRDRAAPFLAGVTAQALARWRPDVIHQHFATLSGAAVHAHRSTGAPLLLTLHGADVSVSLTPLMSVNGLARARLAVHQRGIRRTLLAATRVLAVSEYLAERAVAAGADPHRVAVHYQGIDTERYQPLPDVRPEEPRIAFVGALSERKGVRDLVEQSVRLHSRSPHRLAIVGEGPLRDEVEGAAREHPHIEVHGALDQDGVRGVLARSTVFALPTRRDGQSREAAGLATLEAQAMGVPVVVYDSGGAKEMLDDGVTGLVVPEGDVDALGEALGSLLELSEHEQAAIGVRARDFVVQHRSLAGSAQQLSDHYEEITR
ncbi:glycosyltransferase [Microbacterium sp. NPDC089318]